MISVHSCVRGKIPVHLHEGWWFPVHSCVTSKILVLYLRDDDSVHSCVRGRMLCIFQKGDDWRCIQVWGVRFRCIYLRDDDFGAFMCEGYDIGAFTWGETISVHSCVRGKIPVHLLEGWWFRCILVLGVRIRCIYLRDKDFGAFMCEG